jgi:hypothetical protein
MIITMNRHIAKLSAIAFLVAGICHQAQAQSTDTVSKPRTNLNESVIITTQFDPVVNEAVKISDNPSIFDTVFEAPDFKFSIMNKVFPTRITIEPITAAKVRSESTKEQYKGTIIGGMGTYITPYFEEFYSNSDDNSLFWGVHFKHYSSHYTIKDMPKSHFMTNSLDLFGKKVWDKSVLDAQLYYDNSVHYFYGFNQNVFPKDVAYTNSDIRTTYHNIGFKTTYQSLNKDPEQFNYKATLAFEDLIGSWSQNEFTLNLAADISKTFTLFDNDKQLLGISLDYKHIFDKFSYSSGAPYFSENINNLYATDIISWLVLSSDKKYNTGLFSFAPYFDFKVSKFQLHTALALVPEFGKESSFHFLPTAEVSFPILPDKIFFKGGLNSWAKRESLYNIETINPYIGTVLDLQTTTLYRLFGSLSYPVSEQLSLAVEGGLDKYTNYIFFTHAQQAAYNNIFDVIYDDATRFYFNASARYDIENSFAINGKVEFQSFSTEIFSFAPYEPKLIASVSAQYKPTKKLTFDLTPVFKTGSKAMFYGQEKHLGAIFDLNISAQYQYNEQLFIFLKADNVAFQKYYEYYNYPSQRLMVMIGAKYLFN